MATTFRQSIKKYEARIRQCVELGIPPRDEDVAKLMYYVGQAEKHGLDDTRDTWDKIKQKGITLQHRAGDITELLAKAVALAAK